jgi:tetratricopeptide (TPR) repeat protein
LEITVRKLANDQIEDSTVQTGIDLDAALNGQKKYKTEAPQVSISDLCKKDGVSTTSPSVAVAPVSQPAATPQAAPPPPAPVAETAPATCTTVKACADAMLAAAKREALPSAMESALRIDGMPKPQRGDRKVARKLNAEGLEALKQRKLPDAAATLTKALQADPADEEIISNLIYTYSEDGNFTKAEQLAYDGLLLNPRRANIWLPIAIAKQKQGKSTEALQAIWLAWQFSGDKQKMLTLLDKRIAEEVDGGLKSMYANAKAWAIEGKKPSF